MSKRGVKFTFASVRGVKKSHSHVKRRGKKKQPTQQSTAVNAPILPTQQQYLNSRGVC